MKRNANVRLVLLGLLALGFSMIIYGKPAKDSDHQVAEQLLTEFNRIIPLGSQIETKLGNSIVEPIGNGHYWVTLKNLSLTSDIFWFVVFLFKNVPENFLPDVGPIQVEEMIFLFTPKEKDIHLMATKGLVFDLNYPDLVKKKGFPKFQDFTVKKVHCYIGYLPQKNKNLKELIKPGKKDLPGPIRALLESDDTTLENFKCEVSGMTTSKENLAIFLEIKKIADPGGVKEDSCINTYISNRDAPPPDLLKTLQKGLAVVDRTIEVEKIKVSMKKNGSKCGEGSLAGASYSIFVKPDETRTSFDVCQSIDIKGLELSIPGKKELNWLSAINEFRYAFSMETLKPEAVQALIDLLKKMIELRDMVDSARVQEVQLQIMRIFTEVMKSNPQVKYSIDPFEHYFGKLNAVLEINLKNLFAGPLVKITVNLFKVDEMLSKLKKANVFSAPVLKKITETVEKYAVKTGNGNASIIYELDINQLREYLLKNKPGVNALK